MDIEQLREKGGIVSRTPVKQEVTWQPVDEDGKPHGEPVTFTVRIIKKLSFGNVERIRAIDEADPERSRLAAWISESILLGDDGTERLSYEEAFQLEPSLAIALVGAIGNRTEGAAAKN